MSFSGFLFDGGNCVDIDECMRDRIDCGEYSQEGPFSSKSALLYESSLETNKFNSPNTDIRVRRTLVIMKFIQCHDFLS